MNTNSTDNQIPQETTTEVVYVYFVAFQHQGDGNRGMGFANMECRLPAPITGLADVQMIERYLRGDNFCRALVMGFTLLREEAVPAGGPR